MSGPPDWAPAPPPDETQGPTLVLVYEVDPVTKRRHITLKRKSDLKPTDERVRL